MAEVLNPIELGYDLEENIATAAQKISGLEKNLRELEIRTFFNDPSLNGVDHWLCIGNTHILIQDKWKESGTQQEVAQFLMCAERIQSRLDEDSNIYLIWASKREPTANATRTLQERGAILCCCSISIEDLARNVILQICECFDVDPTDALKSITSNKSVRPIPSSKRIFTAPFMVDYDDTEEGKLALDEMKKLIQQIESEIFRKIELSINSHPLPDLFTVWNSFKPTNWWDGSTTILDFSGFMRFLRTLCWPSKKKQLYSKDLFLYVKIRKLTVLFSLLSKTYESKRKFLVGKKSSRAKFLPVFKLQAEPISEAEYRGAVEFCRDFRIWSYDPTSSSTTTRQLGNSALYTAFHGHECTFF